MDLPIPDPSDGDHFLSPTHAREYIDINDVSFDELKKMMPDVKADTDEKKSIEKSKEYDEGRSFKANNV